MIASRAVFAMMDAAAMDMLRPSPFTIACAGQESPLGRRFPSINKWQGGTAKAVMARFMARKVACNILSSSISAGLQCPIPISAWVRIWSHRASLALGTQSLGIVQALRQILPGQARRLPPFTGPAKRSPAHLVYADNATSALRHGKALVAEIWDLFDDRHGVLCLCQSQKGKYQPAI